MRRSYLIVFALALTALVLSLPGAAAVSQGGGAGGGTPPASGVYPVASLSTRKFPRFIEPQHGQVHGTELSMTALDPQGAGGDSVGSLPVTAAQPAQSADIEVSLPGGVQLVIGADSSMTLHVEWKSGGGNYEVTVTREAGESDTSMLDRFKKSVRDLQESFPPESGA